jgi:hypothetical protein
MNDGKYSRLGRAIKRAIFDFYLQYFHVIFTTFVLISVVCFLYTGVRGLLYLYAPIEDAYYAQHYSEFRSKLNGKAYLKQFLPDPVWTTLAKMPQNNDWEILQKSNLSPRQSSTWLVEQDLSKILFDDRLKVTHEEYEAWEEYYRNKLVWNRNYDGQANPYLSSELQEKYDVQKMSDQLYAEFAQDTIASIRFLGQNARKWLPLNTVVYKRLLSNKVGLPSAWFYKTLSKTMKEMEGKLEQQNEQKGRRYRTAYKYLIAAGFFMGFLICSILYYIRRYIEQVRIPRSSH